MNGIYFGIRDEFMITWNIQDDTVISTRISIWWLYTVYYYCPFFSHTQKSIIYSNTLVGVFIFLLYTFFSIIYFPFNIEILSRFFFRFRYIASWKVEIWTERCRLNKFANFFFSPHFAWTNFVFVTMLKPVFFSLCYIFL